MMIMCLIYIEYKKMGLWEYVFVAFNHRMVIGWVINWVWNMEMEKLGLLFI